ncbi:MAG: hypothetical protein V3T38_02075 [Gammaproteobacteria bacterium]
MKVGTGRRIKRALPRIDNVVTENWALLLATELFVAYMHPHLALAGIAMGGIWAIIMLQRNNHDRGRYRRIVERSQDGLGKANITT